MGRSHTGLLLLLLLLRRRRLLLLRLLLWQLERSFGGGGVRAEQPIVDKLRHERAERRVHAVGGREEDALGVIHSGVSTAIVSRVTVSNATVSGP